MCVHVYICIFLYNVSARGGWWRSADNCRSLISFFNIYILRIKRRSPCMTAGHRAWQQAHLPMSHLINVRAKAGMWLQWAHVHGRALT